LRFFNHQLSAYLNLLIPLNQIKIFGAEMSPSPSSANDVKQDDHDSDYQKNVDETAQGGGCDQPQEPQDKQNNGDSP
jgi:hypothetical protein